MEIGLRIRKLRTQQNRTLQEIADVCGFTKSLLSKIENGVVVPPVATLSKIAKALGVKMSALIEEEGTVSGLFTASELTERMNQVKTDKGYSFFTFAGEYPNKKMQPFLFTARRREVIEHRLSHDGEEFIYMLEGEMKFKVGNVEYILKPGDSIYFDAMEEHGMLPLSEKVKYLDIFVE